MLHIASCHLEFLKVTVSLSCNRAQFLWLCAKSWDLHAQTKKIKFNLFYPFFFMFHIYKGIFSDVFYTFLLRKISKLKFWPRKKSTFRISVVTFLDVTYIIWCNIALKSGLCMSLFICDNGMMFLLFQMYYLLLLSPFQILHKSYCDFFRCYL